MVANGCQSMWDEYTASQDFLYEEVGGEVRLTLTNGKVVRMQFRERAVTVYESHRYTSSVYEIAAFIQFYGKEKLEKAPRSKRKLAGELRLHGILYRLCYRRKQTKDADVEYTADKRWYVNVASVVLG